MILKILSVCIRCIIFNNLVSCFISANNLSQNAQCGIDQTSLLTKTFELCFLTMCFDVKCSCVDAKKDTCSLNTTADGNTRLRTGETTLNCMIFNTRINETKNGQEKQNDVQKRGMLCRLYNKMKFNRIVVCTHIFNESLNKLIGQRLYNS